MCLATPVRIEEIDGDLAWGELGGNRLRLSLALLPEAAVGDWVLVHAGFALERLDEAAARATFDVLRQLSGGREAP